MIKEVKAKGIVVGYVVIHCHGKDKGKRVDATPEPVPYEKALKIHRAIEASKARRAKGLPSYHKRSSSLKVVQKRRLK